MLKSKNALLTVFLSSFLFLQYIILRLANQSGSGFLPKSEQELVYCFTQVAVILGFACHFVLRPFIRSDKAYKAAVISALGVCFAGASVMMFAPVSSAFYLAVTGVTVFALGVIGSAVYLRVSAYTACSSRVGLCMGLSYAVGITLQFFLQLEWTLTPLLYAVAVAAFGVLAVFFVKSFEEKGSSVTSFVKPRALVITSVIALAMLIFSSYYNSYIHHLQISSGYTTYNAYTWPRFVMMAGILLFGIIGDIKNGKLLPISTFCMVLIALLNAVLIGSDAYILNMCLYYLSLSASIAYYNLTFLRLAPRTRHPALWASFGRVLDSFCVILSFVFGFSTLSAVWVLVIDITALVLIVVMLAVSGGFNLSSEPEPETEPSQPEDTFEKLRERFGLTPTELKVFRELVTTEDKQEAVAHRLSISVNTLRHHVTAIYRKTGAQTRAGLCRLAVSGK